MAPAIAIALANFAPTILKFLGAGEGAIKVADTVATVATRISGAKTPEEAIDIFQKDHEKAWAFKLEILAMDKQLTELSFSDLKSARERDMTFITSGKRNIRADSIYVISVSIVVLLVYMIWTTPELSEFVKGAVTLLLGRFTGYIDQIVAFEFGTTRSSQKKDDTIKSLSGDK